MDLEAEGTLAALGCETRSLRYDLEDGLMGTAVGDATEPLATNA